MDTAACNEPYTKGTHVADSVTCHPAEVTFQPLPQPIKAGTWFSDWPGKNARL